MGQGLRFPLVLGKGKSIFDASIEPRSLKLVDSFVTQTGVDIATYEPAGDVQTGSFETKEPSAEEKERREKMAEGRW